jgi:two-component system, cell cycle sensor histidine kinase PleC
MGPGTRRALGTRDSTVVVADTCIGIGADDRTRVFQPFVQVEGVSNREPGGAGLGLALVKQLTELHGGSVSLESELGSGTLVRVRLPFVRSKEQSAVQLFSGSSAPISD